MVLTIPRGFHPGVGLTDRYGGDHGARWPTMTTIRTGVRSDLITPHAIRTGFFMATITGPTEGRRLSSTTDIIIRLIATDQTVKVDEIDMTVTILGVA